MTVYGKMTTKGYVNTSDQLLEGEQLGTSVILTYTAPTAPPSGGVGLQMGCEGLSCRIGRTGYTAPCSGSIVAIGLSLDAVSGGGSCSINVFVNTATKFSLPFTTASALGQVFYISQARDVGTFVEDDIIGANISTSSPNTLTNIIVTVVVMLDG